MRRASCFTHVITHKDKRVAMGTSHCLSVFIARRRLHTP